jgi:hypothetical protein
MTDETLKLLSNAIKKKMPELVIMEEGELFEFQFFNSKYQPNRRNFLSKFYLGAILFGPPYVFDIYQGSYNCPNYAVDKTFTILLEGTDFQFSVTI